MIDVPEKFIASGDRTAIKRHFDEVHDRRYGTCAPSEPAELVSLRKQR